MSSIAAGAEAVAATDALVKVDVRMRTRRDQLFLALDVLERLANNIQRRCASLAVQIICKTALEVPYRAKPMVHWKRAELHVGSSNSHQLHRITPRVGTAVSTDSDVYVAGNLCNGAESKGLDRHARHARICPLAKERRTWFKCLDIDPDQCGHRVACRDTIDAGPLQCPGDLDDVRDLRRDLDENRCVSGSFLYPACNLFGRLNALSKHPAGGLTHASLWTAETALDKVDTGLLELPHQRLPVFLL